MAPSVSPALFKTRPAVRIGNDAISATILTGGGHIVRALQPISPPAATPPPAAAHRVLHAQALVQRADSPFTNDESEDFGSPLWIPPWPTADPALSELADPEIFGELAPTPHPTPPRPPHSREGSLTAPSTVAPLARVRSLTAPSTVAPALAAAAAGGR